MLPRRYSVVTVFLSALSLAGCNSIGTKPYKDEFPEPCSSDWFVEIEREVNLVNHDTGRPPPGSPQWLAALDEKYSVAKNTSTEIGDIEWCHQIHQQLIGL